MSSKYQPQQFGWIGDLEKGLSPRSELDDLHEILNTPEYKEKQQRVSKKAQEWQQFAENNMTWGT